MKLILLALLLNLLAGPVLAKQFREPGYSVRAMGMGNAYTAIVDDSDALFYNPAALGRVRGVHWTVGDLNLGVNGMNVYNTVQSMSGVNSIEDFSELYGEYLWIGGGGHMAFTLPNFGIAYYTSAFVDLEMQRPSMPELDAGYINDQGIIIGGAFELWENAYFGIAAKRVLRQGGEETVGIGTLADGDITSVMDEFSAKGVGYGIDLGFLMEMEGALRPTLSVAWKDVGYTTFFPAEEGVVGPPTQKHDLTAGFGLIADLPLVTISTAIDVKHLLDYDEQFGKKVHLGTEIDMPFVALRGGFHQGYYTYGVGLDLFIMRLDLASYGVERGVYPGQIEDRRYDIKLRMEFGIDVDFSLSSLSSWGGGRLKQRR